MTIIKRTAQTKTFNAGDTDGSWNSVSMPSGYNAQCVTIQVHDNGGTSYNPETYAKPFQFSHDSDGSDGKVLVSYAGLRVPEGASGQVLGYVKAETGNKVVLLFDDI